MNMVSRIMRAPTVALRHDDILGEGPVWDRQAKRLSWVDIKRRRVQTWSPGGLVQVRELAQEVSLAIPTYDGRQVIAQVDHLLIGDDSELSRLCAIDPDNSWTRLNDGCCDEQGNLWVGTYSTRGEPEAAVFRVDSEGHAERMLTGLIAANGMAWTADGSGLWVTDTGRGRIDLYSPTGSGGRLELVRELMVVDDAHGRPDGIALDCEGAVWVAMWGGGQLRRYAPNGKLTDTVRVPVTYPTSVAFGDPELATLYVTTSSHHLDENSAEAHAGSLLALDADTPGLPTPLFNLA